MISPYRQVRGTGAILNLSGVIIIKQLICLVYRGCVSWIVNAHSVSILSEIFTEYVKAELPK